MDRATTQRQSRGKIRLLQVIFGYFVGLKLWFTFGVSPMGDEAYYWMWGQHLSWSYFDHPPLDGWLQGVVALLFGWNNLSVRLLTWLTFYGTLWIIWLWSARLAPDDREGWFWHTAVIYFSIPVIAMMTTFAFHDHLMLFLVVASAYWFDGFATAWEAGERNWRRLYVAAALLGLAVLTKYNAVFLGLGYAVWILARPRLRPLLLTPQLWLAALLAIAIQAPVFYWNLTEGMASFRFHLAERPNVHWNSPRLAWVRDFAATTALVMSPVLFLSLARLPWLRRNPAEARAASLSASVFFVSTAAWAVISAYVYVFFHWNVVAVAALLPVAYLLVGGRIAFFLHIGFGLLVSTVAIVTYTLTPLTLLGVGDKHAAPSFGWPQLAAEVRTVALDHPDAFFGATRYTYAAQLGFQLHNADVAAFNPIRSQNDYWWDEAAHLHRDAIVIADDEFPIRSARSRFASIEKLAEVPVTDRLGKHIWTFEIWLGHDFGGAAE